MPEGTLHAVRNLTPALSFHRFHLDTVNLGGFWRALVDGDSASLGAPCFFRTRGGGSMICRR